ncbi:MFS transporter [Buchnera aphidicola (Ceratoglyphina bambusae)]|uniref:MFS transporter n=1 Tax=Buchnera aphidicola TaxID=9 RepID=UPI0031B7F0AE
MKNFLFKKNNDIKIIFIVCIIFAIRNISLFFIFPIFNLYSLNLYGSTKLLNSICLASYGIFQIISQVPFGIFSNKYGKKNAILFGLLLFFFGNLICFFSNSIFGFLIGRIVQGISSISSVLMSFLLTSISSKNRVLAVFFIGITFGLTFFISMSISLFVFNFIGLHGFFLIMSFFSLFLIFFSYFFLPNNDIDIISNKNNYFLKKNISYFLKKKKFLNLLKCTFFTNFIFSSNFLVFSEIFSLFKINKFFQWKIYFYIFLISFFISILIIFFIKKNKYINNSHEIFFLFFLFSEIIFLFNRNLRFLFFISLQIFFISYNLISTVLPILIRNNFNKKEHNNRNIFISIQTTLQLFGMSLGSVVGGVLYNFFGFNYIFIVCIVFIILYFKTK